jgi:uncharacterized membrane protein YqjE
MARPADPSHFREERPAAGAVGGDGRSLGDLFTDLTQETTTLVRQEVQLAKTEMSQKAAAVGKDVGFLVAGGAVLYAGLLALIATIIIVLAYAIPWWLSALIVSIVVLAIGGFLVRSGLDNLKQTSLAPTQTLETLKEDATWTKEQI